ncbi:MAG: transporter substrate-binding domain-containing protein [Clostridia bacterium]|nr:transporter substrate-binding domain-containing protein [Clostridia bacterium]
MKKILALLAAAALVATTFAFAGCEKKVEDADANVDGEAVEGEVEGEVAEGEDKEAVEDEENAATEDEKEEEKEDETVAEDEGKLVMATNAYFQPYEYFEGDKIVGIDVEIAEAIAEKLGLELVIDDMEFNSIIAAVQSGAADMGVAGMTVTEERLESVDFSYSYANGVQSIIVAEGSAITTVDDLYAEGADYQVGVQLATTGDIYSTDDFGEENVTRYSNGSEAVLALQGGDIDCVIIDNEPAKALVAANEGLVILETSYADEDYAICVKKGNTELLDKINVAIEELTAEGKIEEIVAKYIK